MILMMIVMDHDLLFKQFVYLSCAFRSAQSAVGQKAFEKFCQLALPH